MTPLARSAATPETPPLPTAERPSWLDAAVGDATGRGVDVGIVDSGLDPAWRDPALRAGVGLLARGGGFRLHETDDWEDRIGHGTSCARIVREMAPGAAIVPLRVFDRRLETSAEVLIAALRWAVERRIAVVNLSLGTRREHALRPLYAACEEASRQGMVIVAAVERHSGESYPAVFANALGVAADEFANVFDFRYLPGAAVECVAAGRRRVHSLGGERLVYGNSYAAPHVAALAALVLERTPAAGLEGVRRFLAAHSLETRS
jgi:subtilisin family serine protease